MALFFLTEPEPELLGSKKFFRVGAGALLVEPETELLGSKKFVEPELELFRSNFLSKLEPQLVGPCYFFRLGAFMLQFILL